MKTINLTSSTFLKACLLWAGLSRAQESVNASGGEATGNGGAIAYSIGQTVSTTLTGISGSVAQGVQQAYEIYALGIEETAFGVSLSAYPNPTTENLTLQINQYNNEKLSYQLFDMQGKLFNSGEVRSNQTEINTASLPPAAYVIHVFNEAYNNRVQSFKIVKNQ